MKSLVLVMCLSLTGCFYQTVNQFDIGRASKVCGGVEKIVQISAAFDGREKVLCLNAEQFLLKGLSAE
jgi:hypothetical protein